MQILVEYRRTVQPIVALRLEMAHREVAELLAALHEQEHPVLVGLKHAAKTAYDVTNAETAEAIITLPSTPKLSWWQRLFHA